MILKVFAGDCPCLEPKDAGDREPQHLHCIMRNGRETGDAAASIFVFVAGSNPAVILLSETHYLPTREAVRYRTPGGDR